MFVRVTDKQLTKKYAPNFAHWNLFNIIKSKTGSKNKSTFENFQNAFYAFTLHFIFPNVNENKNNPSAHKKLCATVLLLTLKNINALFVTPMNEWMNVRLII